jgi:hypothetical protein
MIRNSFQIDTAKRGTAVASSVESASSEHVSLIRPRGAHVIQSGTVNIDIIIRPGLICYHCELLIAPDGKPFFFLFSSSRAAEAGDESRACFDLSICQWKFAKNPRDEYQFCM